MQFKIHSSVSYLIIILYHGNIFTQSEAQEETFQATASEPLPALLQPENLTNLAPSSQVLILIPSNTNLSEWQFNDANYNLFKLNADILFRRDHVSIDETIDGLIENDHGRESDIRKRLVRDLDGGRGSRKMGFLGNMWNKPRMSPLYLVNGTVCRFVNGAPVCTTLSTTGLLPGTGGGPTTARPAASGLQGGGNSAVQFASTQQPRPAGLMDDDAQDINVEGMVNSTDGSMVVRGQQQSALRPVAAIPAQSFRPVNFVVSRRPLNLLALRRPVRRYQSVSGRSGIQSLANSGVQYQVSSRNGKPIT